MLIEVDNISVNFGERPILEGLSLSIKKGNRIGLIGHNGAGKSTLLKCIMQEIEPQLGEIKLQKNIKLGYLTQNPKLTKGNSLTEELATVFTENNLLKDKENELLKQLEDPNIDMDAMQDCLTELADIQEKIDDTDSNTQEQKIGRMIAGLGFSEEDKSRLVEDFSGGWQMRINLAKLLLSEAELLLLDEPTNHLDLTAATWLTEFLINYPNGMLIVSHDRYFLDQVVNQVALLERGRIDLYQGNYTSYLAEKEIRHEQQMAAALRQEKQIAEQQKFIDRFKAKATKSSQAKSREKQLAKIEIIEKPVTEIKSLKFNFEETNTLGRDILKIKKLSKAFGTKQLFKDVSTNLEWDQKTPPRVFILGDNGCGKTTFFKILTKEINADAGEITFDTRVNSGYYAQHQLQILDPNKTLLDTIADIMPAGTHQTDIRGILGRFMFRGKEVFSQVKGLSGGEKARLAMAKLMVQKPNLLLLDEPTNHLDLAAQESIENALASFSGAIITISHDRYFIERHATHIWEFNNQGLISFTGSYPDYLEKRPNLIEKNKLNKIIEETKEVSSSTQRLFNKEKELKKLERKMEKISENMKKLEIEMTQKENLSDYQKLADLQSKVDILKSQHSATEHEWAEIAEQVI